MKKRQAITTRFASSADAHIVHGMLVDLGVSMDDVDKISCTVQDVETALSGSAPDIHAIIAEKNSEAVGMTVIFLTFSTWRGTRGVYVQDIYVADGVRGIGLGARLLKEVIAWAVNQGADHLRLSVDRNNTSARSFYEKLGLSLRGDEMIYTIVGDSFIDLGFDS